MEAFYKNLATKHYSEQEINYFRDEDYSWEMTYKNLHNKASLQVENVITLDDYFEDKENLEKKLKNLMTEYLSISNKLNFITLDIESSDEIFVKLLFHFFPKNILSEEEKASLLVDFEEKLRELF